MSNSYYVLGYPVKGSIESLYKYVVKDAWIEKARNLMYKDRIPHYVSRDHGSTGLAIYATSRSTNLEKELNIDAIELDTRKLAEPAINLLLGSGIRVVFLSKGWARASNKIFNKGYIWDKITGEGVDLVHVYRAIRYTVDDLSSNLKVFFIDPASKVEFQLPMNKLAEYFPQKKNLIRWVKIANTIHSFYVVESEGDLPRGNAKGLDRVVEDTRGVIKVLSQCLDIDLGVVPASSIMYVMPKSLRLSECLRTNLPGMPVRGSRIVVPIPSDLLVPVGDMYNVSLFGKITLTVSPKRRVEIVENMLKHMELCEVEVNGLRLSVDTKSIIQLNQADYEIEDKLITKYIQLIDKDCKSKKLPLGWNPKFRPSDTVLLLLLRVRIEREDKRALYSELCQIVLSELFEYRSVYAPRNLHIEVVDVSPDLSDLDKAIDSYAKSAYYNYKLSILLYVSMADPDKKLVGLYEYEMARRGFYPHTIDLTEFVEDKSDKKSLDKAENTIFYKLLNILRDFCVRINATPFKLAQPIDLKDFVVAGVDATIKATPKGYLFPAVAVVILKPDGVYETRFQSIGVSDVDALASSILGTVEEYDKVIVVVNRSSLRPILSRLSDKIFDRLADGSLVLVSVSKTHSYSRILRRYKGTYVNPTPSDIGLLVKLKSGEIQIRDHYFSLSRYLAITTTYPKDSDSVGTVVPVVMNIAGGVNHGTVAKYMASLSHYAKISPLWAPSLPWPLHKANKLCRKIHRILDAKEAVILVNNILRYL